MSELRKGKTISVKKDLEKNWKTPTKFLKKVAPGSYLVQTEKQGELRRNWRHLYRVSQDLNYQVSKNTIDLDMEQ